MRDVNELAADIHRRNAKWWHTEDGVKLKREPGELLMLVVSEEAEAMEGLRKDLMDDKLPHRKMEEVEQADAFIRLCDFAAGFAITLDQAMLEARELFKTTNKPTALFEIITTICMIMPGDRFYISVALAQIIDYCEQFGLDLWGAIDEKQAYNDTRVDHTWAARKAANGKKF